jgi:hypothetical protein
MRRRHLLAPLVSTSLLLGLLQLGVLEPAAGVAPMGGRAAPKAVVISRRAAEILPAADAPYLAWSQNSSRHPNHFDAFYKNGTEPRQRVNEQGTKGFAGGIDGTTLIWQVVKNARSNLRLHDLATSAPLPIPADVNTDAWEWRPTISGSWLLFGRSRRYADRIVLADVGGTTAPQPIAADSAKGIQFTPGQVNGTWATYSRCGRRNPCDVFLYDILNDSRLAIPGASERYRYAASVAPDGTVYYAQSRSGCGRSVRIMRYVQGTDPAAIATLPKGKDVFKTYVDAGGGAQIVYYDRFDCERGGGDIFSEAVT